MATSFTPLRHGPQVFASDGSRIGRVAATAAGILVVRRGRLRRRPLYVPASAIDSLAEDRVRLAVRKDDIDILGWHEPPIDPTAPPFAWSSVPLDRRNPGLS